MVHTFNACTGEVTANLVYTVRSRPAEATQRLCFKKRGEGEEPKTILFSSEEREKNRTYGGLYWYYRKHCKQTGGENCKEKDLRRLGEMG